MAAPKPFHKTELSIKGKLLMINNPKYSPNVTVLKIALSKVIGAKTDPEVGVERSPAFGPTGFG